MSFQNSLCTGDVGFKGFGAGVLWQQRGPLSRFRFLPASSSTFGNSRPRSGRGSCADRLRSRTGSRTSAGGEENENEKAKMLPFLTQRAAGMGTSASQLTSSPLGILRLEMMMILSSLSKVTTSATQLGAQEWFT